MIIIDDLAEKKLLQWLQDPAIQLDSYRCIHMKIAQRGSLTDFELDIILKGIENLEAENAHVYFCSDGDILIFAQLILPKNYRVFAQQMVAALTLDGTAEPITLYEVAMQRNFIIALIEQKLEARRKDDERKKQKMIAEEAAQKRQLLLEETFDAQDAAAIIQRRILHDKPQVMIIEDDHFSRQLVENVLKNDCQITGLRDAENALKTYFQLAPHVLFLDINLPLMNGHELLERIIKADPDAYIVMLSGHTDRDNVTRSINAGAKGFVSKPFNREKLFQYLRRCPGLSGWQFKTAI